MAEPGGFGTVRRDRSPGVDGGVAVARPGSRRLLTRPVAQLDSTRLSARWQEAAARARGGRATRERRLSRGEGESVGAGRRKRMGLEVAEAGAGAVGALLFAVEGGGSWGRKGGRRIDPDGAWLTADEAVTRDESRRDGRTEKAPPRFSAPPRGAPLSPNGFWRSELAGWWWVAPVGGRRAGETEGRARDTAYFPFGASSPRNSI